MMFDYFHNTGQFIKPAAAKTIKRRISQKYVGYSPDYNYSYLIEEVEFKDGTTERQFVRYLRPPPDMPIDMPLTERYVMRCDPSTVNMIRVGEILDQSYETQP